MDEATVAKIQTRLSLLYGDKASEVCDRLLEVVRQRAEQIHQDEGPRWSERDAVLITYGDQVQTTDEAPLKTLVRWLQSSGLIELIQTVHFLPFFPYSSDDGFSVIDYRQIDPNLGDWDDVSAVGEHSELMFDLVLNHCSQESDWFQAYLRGDEPYTSFFIEPDPELDLSGVTRPRSLPLLHEFETSRGLKHVWTTFSRDQVDLNFAEPAVLIEMIDILLFYAQRGARIIRLDAIAYLWKEAGTSCIHLPETHEVVKLMRDVLEFAAPQTLLLTETNVPHDENISYFGDGDEAHLVYNFSLPPLLLEAFLSEDGTSLCQWLAGLQYPPNTTYFNFTASHDGIGVRPLEGLVSQERFDQLIAAMRARGAHVNTKRDSSGKDSPYELNITYFSALADPDQPDPTLHAQRFLASQAIMLFLRGIPGIYFHSLIGTPNYVEGVQQTGHNRTINRRKFDLDELHATLADETSAQAQVLSGYKKLLQLRRSHPAFHPDAEIEVIDLGLPSVLAFSRTETQRNEQVLVVVNLSRSESTVHLPDDRERQDLLSANVAQIELCLNPYQVACLV